MTGALSMLGSALAVVRLDGGGLPLDGVAASAPPAAAPQRGRSSELHSATRRPRLARAPRKFAGSSDVLE
jgi:hypothetical protein